jgi:hypothetical protein
LGLNLACWNYDRTRALADQSIQPDGIDLNHHDLPVEAKASARGEEEPRRSEKI